MTNMRKGEIRRLSNGYSYRMDKQFRGRQTNLGKGYSLLKDGKVIASELTYTDILERSGFCKTQATR